MIREYSCVIINEIELSSLLCSNYSDAQARQQYKSFRLSYDLRPYEFAPIRADPDTEGETFDPEPTTTTTTTTQAPVTVKPKPSGQGNQFQSDDSVCGVPVAGFTQSLVIGGQAAGHGEW